MGGHQWFYIVDYQQDVACCLEQLKEREFRAGRYNPVQSFPKFPVDLKIAPGAKHQTIAAALKASGADGTRSILDIESVAKVQGHGRVVALAESVLLDYYGTNKPTTSMILENDEFMEDVGRGEAVYVVTYENDQPREVYFGGYSYD